MTASTQVPDQDAPAAQAGTPGLVRAPRALGLDRRQLVRGTAVAGVALVVGLFLPWVLTDPYYMGVAADGVVLGILALGIGFLANRSGVISLGHTGFYGASAYTVAIVTNQWGWGPTQAALFAVLTGTVLAILVGALVIRATGMGFLVLTLAFGQALYQVSIMTSLRDVTGSYDGLPVIWSPSSTFFGMTQAQVTTADTFWPLAWGTLVVVAYMLWVAGRSRFGTLLEAIRENEERTRFSGYDTYFPRLAAFGLSGFCAALAGVLFSLKASFVSPDVMSFVMAGDAVIATLVGGFTVLLGPLLGAVLYIYAQGQFGETGSLQLYMGLALIITVTFLPGGLTGWGVEIHRKWLRRRAARRAAR